MAGRKHEQAAPDRAEGAAMTSRYNRDLERLLATIALRANAKLVEIRKTNGGHVRARFDRGGLLFLSSTPSDIRTIKKDAAQAKRLFRRMTA
jgi:hypothetical protein